MDLALTDYQGLMVDTFRDLFTRHATPETARAAEKAGGHDAGLWSRVVAIGGHVLSVPEAAGGGGGNILDAVLVGKESGQRVAPIPYADTVAALRLVHDVAGPLPGELAGGALITRADPEATEVHRAGDGSLTGRIRWTRAGAAAAFVAVVVDDQLVLVALDQEGVIRRPVGNLGRMPVATVEFDAARPADAWPVGADVLARSRAEARLLSAAELVGAGRGAFALALEHVKSRHQFDRPIGSFQAVQHRLADRHTALDAAELLLLRAACYGDEPEALRRFSAVALLRAREAAELAAKEALQFFGGYGFVLEYDVHLYLRFVKALGVLARDGRVVEDALSGRLRRPAEARR